MGINDEDLNAISAREIVAWYNGLPDCQDSHELIEKMLRKCEIVSLIGQGNVAIDVARILLSPIDLLAKTDITSRALSTLSECNIRNVHLIGRRGPLQAAFTIKEIREMLKLPNVSTVWRKSDFCDINEQDVSKLVRPKKRIIELMLKSVSTRIDTSDVKKYFSPIFFRSPKYVECVGNDKRLHLIVNQLCDSEVATPTPETETIQTNLILRSIGYKSVNVTQRDDMLNFDAHMGLVPNKNGRVYKLNNQDGVASSEEHKYEHGLYVSGWLGTGPTGVLLTTMNNSFLVAKNICQDIQSQSIACTPKPGLDFGRYASAVSWQDWLKIDKCEIQSGASVGKPREKILQTSKMLEILK